MFSFSATSKPVPAASVAAESKPAEVHPLDAMTLGAFSAPTSGERTACIRNWLASEPAAEQMQVVFKELSAKDKGAARLLREKLDEIKRNREQASIAHDWADKAQGLLDLPKLNIADAMAWQRDAAKAGAPLSKEPLATLKTRLSERVRVIEDLQHRVQVQREAAVLLAQRIEVLSTKPWREAQALLEALRTDVAHWQEQAQSLQSDANWPSVDMRFVPLLEASRAQLWVVWEAFGAALALALAAAEDAAAPLPPVPVWADELRAARGLAAEPVAKPKKPQIDPEIRAQGIAAVRETLQKLEQEVAQGHGKASTGAANALRNALKEFGKLIDDKLENQAHAALAAAGELEGWQRWRADQLREELVGKAEGLLQRPPGQEIGGRKMQETLRALREQWKQTDQGGVPNHALWKRFDEACNEAHKVVEAWLERLKAESALHRAQRMALIEELQAWARDNPVAKDDDWKGFGRILHQFAERWRDGGHVGEKIYAELQPLWKEALQTAAAPLEALQKHSVAARQALIEEAKLLGAAPDLRIDAVKALQQRWQAQTHVVPLERRLEQKLWDAFRKPLDEAFARKTAQREQAAALLSERDALVLQAARALETANRSADAQAIRLAMDALEAALRGQAQAQAAVAASTNLQENEPQATVQPAQDATELIATVDSETPVPAPAPQAVRPVARPVVAVRGDDRPGQRRTEPAAQGRAGKWGERKDAPRDAGRGAPSGRREGAAAAREERMPRRDAREGYAPRAELPRLGDTAFRAQRDALEHAQLALRKLAAQAHGESLAQLMVAWQQRDANQLPGTQELGSRVPSSARAAWAKALGVPPTEAPGDALLRLEMAAELPTPAHALEQRRALQLQLLTRRHDAPPAQTWVSDVARVFTAAYDEGAARRVQATLKVLLKS